MNHKYKLLNKLSLFVIYIYVRLNGYRTCKARTEDELRTAFRLRWKIYTEAGYVSGYDYPDGEIKDRYDKEAIIFIVCYHRLPVGTVRLIPIRKGAPIFEFFNIVGQLDKATTAEIGRLAVLKKYRTRDRAATLGLILETYSYSVREKINYWIGFAPRQLLRTFNPFVKYELLEIQSPTLDNLRAREHHAGYFNRYKKDLVVFKINVNEIKPWRWKKSR